MHTRPQDSIDEAIHKLTFIHDVFTLPLDPQERFTLSNSGLTGLGLILWETREQLAAASDALVSRLLAKEV